MKNNIETPSYSIHEGGYNKEKHLMLKMQNNFQDKFLDSILFDPDKTDRTEFFELPITFGITTAPTAASIPMIATTIKSSIRVKPFLFIQ